MLNEHGDVEESLQEIRLRTLSEFVSSLNAETVLDLGCGPGELIVELSKQRQIKKILGIDVSQRALNEARSILNQLGLLDEDRVQLQNSSFLDRNEIPRNFDIAILMETVEHIDPKFLTKLEQAVFNSAKPKAIIFTTPNKEYNELYGLEPHESRHPEHFFEWDRNKFQTWASGVALRQNYEVEFHGIGPFDDLRGHPTQMALFKRVDV